MPNIERTLLIYRHSLCALAFLFTSCSTMCRFSEFVHQRHTLESKTLFINSSYPSRNKWLEGKVVRTTFPFNFHSVRVQSLVSNGSRQDKLDSYDLSAFVILTLKALCIKSSKVLNEYQAFGDENQWQNIWEQPLVLCCSLLYRVRWLCPQWISLTGIMMFCSSSSTSTLH